METQGEQSDKPKPQSKNPIVNLYMQGSPSQKRTIMAQLYRVIGADGDRVEFTPA
jgi:hypothetical protein